MSNFGDLKQITLLNQNQRSIQSHLLISPSRKLIRCVIGRNGQTVFKKEGDGKTPRGTWSPQMVYYRADRGQHPKTTLPIKTIKPNDGWCDDPTDRNYNRPVPRPYPASTETFWRKDELYDLIVVLNHNQCPRIKGRGSAIFMHVAKQNFPPTQGCVALEKKQLHQLLPLLKSTTKLII